MKTAKIRAGITLLVLTASMLPQSLLAAGCTVSAMDTVAGLGTQVDVSGCPGQSGTQLIIDGPTGTPVQQPVSLDGAGNATVNLAGKYTQTAGTYNVSFGAARSAFSVLPDAPDDAQSTLAASAMSMQPGGQITVTAVLRDRYENPLAGRPVALLSNRQRDVVSARDSQTDEDGRFTWTVRAGDQGAMTLTAYDVLSSRQLSTRLDIAVGNGIAASPSFAASLAGSALTAQMNGMGQGDTSVVDHFKIQLSKEGSVNANELFSLSISALDLNNQVVQGYTNTVDIETTDADAEFPKKGQNRQRPSVGWVDFRPMDLGVRSVPLGFVFRNGGAQTITVYDEKDPSIRGTLVVQVIKEHSSADDEIRIVAPADNAVIGTRDVHVVGKGPVLVNIKVKGGVQPVFTDTDENGTFQADVKLDPTYDNATLYASKEDGTNESQGVRVRIDETPPKVDTITFDPQEGKTKDPFTVTVTSEPGLKEATADFEGQTLTLAETSSGTYVAHVDEGPAQEGTYDMTVNLTDPVGNKSTMMTKWTVKRKTLPVVGGVTAEGQPSAVLISWNAITEVPVSEYRIYIATEDDPQNFIASVDTNSAVTSAIIKDLDVGTNYQFSVTALNNDGQESADKSEPATASPLGLLLTARPDNESLILEWNPPSSLPLAHYILEYGTEPGVYTERRTINASLHSFTLHDLINDVTYEVRLTPIAVTGKVLNELSAVTRGTPSGEAGFHAGAGDPIPDDMTTTHPGGVVQPPITEVPTNTGSGPSSAMAGGLLVVAALLGIIWNQHRRQKTMTQQFLEMMNQRYHS